MNFQSTSKANRWVLFLTLLNIVPAVSQVTNLTGSANGLYGTGYNGNVFDSIPAANTSPYTPLIDSHYQIVAVTPGSAVDIQTVNYLATPLSAYQAYDSTTASGVNVNWAPNQVGGPNASQWISIGSSSTVNNVHTYNFQGQINTIYDYRLTLTNITLGDRLTITGTTTSDNTLLITANDRAHHFFSNETALINNPTDYNTPANFVVQFATRDTNFIDFNVLNDSTGGPTGLQVHDLSGTMVPLPQVVTKPVLIGIIQGGIYSPIDLTTILNTGTWTGSDLTPVLSSPLTPNAQAVFNNINNINSSGNTNPAFIGLTLSLLNVGTNLSTVAYDEALRQLSPEKFGVLSTYAFNNASFLALDLDNYLAHRRDDHGNLQVVAGKIDTSGLVATDPTLSPMMNQVKTHLRSQEMGHPATRQDPGQMEGVDDQDTDRLNLFVRGEVILAQNFSDGNQAGEDHTNGTTTSCELGMDYQLDKHWLVGGFLSYNHTDASIDNLGSQASIDGYSPGVYASYANEGWYVNGMGSVQHNFYTTNRNIQFDTINTTAYASPQANQEMTYVDGGYEFHHASWTYGPMIGLMYNHLDINPYSENGAGVEDLNVQDQSANSVRSRLGGRLSREIKSGKLLFTPHLDVSWQHEYLDNNRGITSSFSSEGPNTFTVQTEFPERDSALVGTGFDLDLERNVTFFGEYQVQAGQSNYFGQMVQVGWKLAF